MLALLVLSLAAAFPPRGFVRQPAGDSVVLDRDTVHIDEPALPMECDGIPYSLGRLLNPGLAIDSFPGHPRQMTFVNIRSMHLGCQGGLVRSFKSSKFRIEGQSRWALWVDSVWLVQDPRSPAPSNDPLGGRFIGCVRWRWSRVEGSLPWARWTDTVRLDASGELSDSVPLLSLLDTSVIDSVVPAEGNGPRPAFGQNLTLRKDTVVQRPIWIDTIAYLSEGKPLPVVDPVPDSGYPPATLTWASTRGGPHLQRAKTWTKLPTGNTLFVTGAGTDSAGTRLWRIWSGGAVRDSFWVERPSPAALRTRRASPRSPGGSWTIDGRRRTELPLWSPRFGIGEAGSIGGTK